MSNGEKPQKRFDRSIVEGSLPVAVWTLAWPTMLQNVVGGMQGIVDQAMVGYYVGHTGNAAIGVSLLRGRWLGSTHVAAVVLAALGTGIQVWMRIDLHALLPC